MIIDNKKSNRCGIFLFYDRDGKVDDYITYMIKDLRKSLKYLLTVCNGQPSEEGMTVLNEISDEVLVRANSGFDVGGYREGLFYLGFKELQKYDEIVLLNYTFFGAIYPFAEAFEKMSSMDLDFWGLTKHHMVDPDPFHKIKYGFLPEHLQSHFLVIRNSLLTSNDYKEFMISMKNPASYTDSICDYETILTKHFDDLGYKWAAYVDSSRYEDYVYSPVMFKITDILKEDRCPIIKRRSFFTDYIDFLANSCGEVSAEMFDYLREHTDYDVNMIWDNLLRLQNMSDISKAMQLNYCNSTTLRYDEKKLDDISINIWVKSTECLEFYNRFLYKLKNVDNINLYGETNSINVIKNSIQSDSIALHDEKIISLQEFVRRVREDVEDDKNLIFICVIDDKGNVQPYSNKMSNIYKDWSCLLATEEYLANERDTFSDNSRMGLGIPPVPEFGDYLPALADGWMGRFADVKEYLDRINIKPNIKENVAPLFPLGYNFVIRREALMNDSMARALSVMVDDDVFTLSLVEIVRDAGYYTGTLYSDEYAEIEITNSDYMLREMNKTVFEIYGPNYFDVVVDRVRSNTIRDELRVASQPQPSKKQIAKAKLKRAIKLVTPYGAYKLGGKVYRKIRNR